MRLADNEFAHLAGVVRFEPYVVQAVGKFAQVERAGVFVVELGHGFVVQHRTDDVQHAQLHFFALQVVDGEVNNAGTGVGVHQQVFVVAGAVLLAVAVRGSGRSRRYRAQQWPKAQAQAAE